MRIRKIISTGIIYLAWGIFFLTSSAARGATLVSIRKGEENDKAWAVLSFDQNVVWLGIFQSEQGRLSLYFGGTAGELNDSTVSLGYGSDRRIYVRQLSTDPPIFRANILYNDEDVPLIVLKKNRNVVVGFKDERLLSGKLTNYADVSPTPGRLVNIVPAVRDNQITTSIQFDGTYKWVGYVRVSRTAVALLITGVGLTTPKRDFEFGEGSLKKLRLFPEKERETPCLKTVMFFKSSTSFSVVRKPRRLLVQTPYVGERTVRPAEKSAALPPVTLPKEKVKATETEQKSLQLTKEKVKPKSEERFVSREKPEIEKKKVEKPYIEKQKLAARVEKKTEKPEEEKVKPLSKKIERKKAGQKLPEKNVAEEKSNIPWDQKVSFEFNSTPIKDVLRLVAASNDLNMVIGEEVKGLVTMDLKGVTLKQTLDEITHTHDCEYIVSNGIITVKSVNVEYAGGRITKIYRLKYADAENAATIIKQVVSNDSLVKVFHPEFLNFSVAGKNRMKKNEVAIQGIRRSSVLVVTDRPEKIKEVDHIIQQLDKPSTQIMIESKVVELAPTRTNQLGINWDKTLTAALQWQEILPNGEANPYSAINENPDKGGAWRMGHLSTSEFKTVLDFLKEKTDSKLISNPRLLAMDNEESSMSVGTTVPIPVIQRGMGGQGDMVTFQYKEVNIQLNVTPHVTQNGNITMYVNPVIEEISDWVEYMGQRAPVTSKRTVNSIVSVKNGETVVIGGLIKNQRIRTRQKVWLLGNLPLLGKLFQHEKYEDKQTDLMIFITPTIVQQG